MQALVFAPVPEAVRWGQVTVIFGVEQRRYWSDEQKRALVMGVSLPELHDQRGASFRIACQSVDRIRNSAKTRGKDIEKTRDARQENYRCKRKLHDMGCSINWEGGVSERRGDIARSSRALKQCRMMPELGFRSGRAAHCCSFFCVQ